MLEPGARVGSFEVIAPLGAGGMGEVYRVRDPRLGREVAMKVLSADRLADEGRRRRLIREARAASALNHPHIVTVHEIGSADGIDFIVMEYVPGQSLDGLIPKSGMPVREALRLAIPIADAVAAAHAQGIVHRDLKPANVIVTRDRLVKVLDFGLAKLVSGDDPGDGEESVTTLSGSDALSRPGAITGTAAYMSPEQATGGKVDARSDIFSFGALLYEMVTGRRAFAGRTVSETLTAVVRDQPKSPRELVAGLPEAFERLIVRCLRKEADRRFQHMADVKVELEEIKEATESVPTVAPATLLGRRRAVWIAVGATGVIASVLAVALSKAFNSSLSSPHVEVFTALPGSAYGPTFSPDGQRMAFMWDGDKQDNADIYVKMIGSSELQRLTSDPADDWMPSWSPDGRVIAFLRGSSPSMATIHIVSPLGGPDRKLNDWPARPSSGLSWSPDGRWLAVARGLPAGDATPEARGLYLLPVDGGEPRPLTRALPSGHDRAPALSPDGRRLAYAACETQIQPWPCDVYVVDLEPGLRPTGAPRRLTRQRFTIVVIAWAPDGRSLVYDSEVGPWLHYLWRVEVDGRRPPQRLEVAGTGARLPALSGTRLAFTRTRDDLDIVRFAGGARAEPFLASSLYEGQAEFSPNGRLIAFESMRSGERMEIWLAASDGRDPVQLTRGPGRWQGSPAWSPDGRRIAFDSQTEDGRWDLWTIDADGVTPRRLTEDPGDENMPSWSRDGRWVYFMKRDGEMSIFRIPATGGTEERVMGLPPVVVPAARTRESVDGTSLFFKVGVRSPLYVHPLAGGPDRKLIECVHGTGGFEITEQAAFYAACDGAGPDRKLRRLDLATGKDSELGMLEKYRGVLAVSPDGVTILYSSMTRAGADLMLVEGFR